MSMSESRLCALWLLAAAATAMATETPTLGVPLDAEQRAALPRTVWPDGRGLPPGSGSVTAGRQIYDAKCRHCHGSEGRGGPGGHLIGDGALAGSDPDPAVNTYWPFATTLWDWTHRSMPMDAPGSLSVDDTYAVTAFLLHLSGLIGADAVLDEHSLPKLRMPNREGFDPVDGPSVRR